MDLPERPAPVVTITDPARPDALAEVLGPGDRAESATRLRPVERILATVVALCVLTAWLGSGRVRNEARRAAVLDRVSVGAFAVGEGTDTADQVVLVVEMVNTGGVPVVIRDLAVPGGWELLGTPPDRLAGDGVDVLGMGHAVTCRTTVRGPREISLAVDVVGVGRRTVSVPFAAVALEDALDTAPLCGHLQAVDAVVVRTSSVDGSGRGIGAALRLVNTSLAPVVVEEVVVRGFRIRDRLPVVLPARSPGLLRLAELAAVELVLTADVVDCRAAHEAVQAAHDSPAPDAVGLLVSGRGGRDIATVDVRGLQDFLHTELLESCRESR